MDGFARRKEQSKDQIRQAAWDLFSQFGVDRVSMADIARKADVSQATIYNNYGSKEAIVREFVTSAVDHLVNHVKETLSPSMRYQDKMNALLQSISEMMANGHATPSVSTFFTSSIDIQNDPEIKKIREAAREQMVELMLNLIEEGRQQGQVSPEIPDEVLSIYLDAFLAIFINPELRSAFNRNPRIVKDIGELMLYGLRGVG